MNDVIAKNATPSHKVVDEPDAHGQAALLLAESILHVLVEKKTLSNDDALGVIQSTCEVKIEVAIAAGESRGRMEESLELLRVIHQSFDSDTD